MQTTLLGFAFAIILALVTALVGPLFVDWSSYRGEFEARASRLTGLDFRVTVVGVFWRAAEPAQHGPRRRGVEE